MPSTFTYPGLYVEEVPSAVRPIAGVSTSDTAFVDYFPRGPQEPVRISSFADFERIYGGLDRQSDASYAVLQYYLNGGQNAWVVRADVGSPGTSTRTLTSGSPPTATLVANAANPGAWGDGVQVAVTEMVPAQAGRFNLFVREVNADGEVVASEAHLNLAMSVTDPRNVLAVVNEASTLVALEEPGTGLGGVPTLATPGPAGDPPESAFQDLSGGSDPNVVDPVTGALITGYGSALQDAWERLDRIDPFLFNLLCIPGASRITPAASQQTILDAAAVYCADKRAFLIVDPPANQAGTPEEMRDWLDSVGNLPHANAATYFPRLLIPDPNDNGRLRSVGASGTMSGVYARTDSARGVWKAPAGTEASLRGARLAVVVNDADNGGLNPLGINTLRNFPVFGNVAWGARTLVGADQRADQWKYVPVRRTALFIENSLVEGLKWVVFEGNDETLWSQIRLNVTTFMQGLFLQGAFQGTTPSEAYLVKCDRTTTTQADIDRGVVNILVGFAPLKPAEFVVIRIQQLAGQAQA